DQFAGCRRGLLRLGSEVDGAGGQKAAHGGSAADAEELTARERHACGLLCWTQPLYRVRDQGSEIKGPARDAQWWSIRALRRCGVCARILNMRRREFLQLSVLASGASFCKAYGLDAVSKTTSLRLTIDPHTTGHTIGADFTGLSYESQQLGDPTFFSPDNAELVALVRRLGERGVLRIGGNTSEYCYWTPNPTAVDLAAASAPVNPST